MYALVRSEELDHISGMLVGLSAFDFNLYIRGEDLERRSDVIDWSMYLRDGNLSAPSRGCVRAHIRAGRGGGGGGRPLTPANGVVVVHAGLLERPCWRAPQRGPRRPGPRW